MATTTLTRETQAPVDWKAVQAQFDRLDRSYIQLGTSQFFASHPIPVREAIEKHQRALDASPAKYILDHEQEYAQNSRKAIARYMAMDKHDDIALTDSTTMGLGTIYTGLNIKKGEEILTSEQNYYCQQEAIKRASERTGATFREVKYYDNIHEVTADEMVHNLIKEVRDNTRVVGTTWVHSSTGLKSPIGQIARELVKINKNRDEENKVLLLVDAVHGFGIETETFDELGADFFITGTHKWLYGPRGTGFVAAKTSAWQHVKPVIPSFSEVMYHIIAGNQQPEQVNGTHMSPGGFHTMEHHWAVPSAFEWAESIGKQNIYNRVHELNRRLKEGLKSLPHVTVYTPMDDELSSGITSFRVDGMSVKDTVNKLVAMKVIATEAPYKESYARFTPGIYNTEEEVDRAVEAVRSLKQ